MSYDEKVNYTDYQNYINKLLQEKNIPAKLINTIIRL